MTSIEDVLGLLKEAKVEEALGLMDEVGDKKTLADRVCDFAGFLAEDKNKPYLAVALLLKALSLDPGNPAIHFNLANTYTMPFMLIEDPSNYERAVYGYERAVELDPGFHDARYNLALLLYLSGRMDEAKQQYRNIRDAVGDDPRYMELSALLR